jgi:F-type H+-transporting ATPase subunit b
MADTWLTIFAQVLNFLILVWLLKRFLYKPILNAIDAREAHIAAELADAAAKEADAQKERDEFQRKNAAFDLQRNDLLTKMRNEVDTERQRLLDEARQAADALSAKRKDALNREQQSLNDEIVRRSQEEVFAIAQKALTDLADTRLEARMSDVFTRRLRELEGEAKNDVAKALETATEPARIRSAFDLPDEQRAAIQQAINETFSADPSTPLRAGIPLEFVTMPDVISGIELIVNGQKVAWSIGDYLASLGKGVRELLDEQAKAKAVAKPEPLISG